MKSQMREANRVCGASFVPLAPLQLKNPPPIFSLTLLMLACVAGQSGARPTVYVRGIIRISYGAGWRGGGISRGGLQRAGKRDRWPREEKGGWER